MTIKDIAKQAGVSVTTVSKILNGRDENISDATRTRVKQVVQENNYITNAVARGLKTKKTNIIGFILPDIVNPYFPEIARGIEDVARDAGFGVIYCNTDNDLKREREYLEFLKARMVDGIIYTRTLQGSQAQTLKDVDIPLVIVDRFADTGGKKNIGRVYVDVAHAIYESTCKLAAAGCKNIALISSAYNDKTDRYFGYVQALEDLGIPFREEAVYLHAFDLETGYAGMQDLLQRDNGIDGVVCGNDLIAIGVLDALRKLAVKVPQQIKVMGLDDIYMANFTNPRLSTMAQPMLELGRVAAMMLIDHLLKGEPLYEKVLAHRFVARESL